MSTSEGQVSLEELNIEQLKQIKQQFDEELQHLTSAFQSLKVAQSKFTAAILALDDIKLLNKDKNILIPLTTSLYVPGKLLDSENVLVDIGTGYFIQKSSKSAKQLYNTKVLSIRSNLSKLKTQIERKDMNCNSVIEVLRSKMMQQDRQMAADGARAIE